MVIFLDGQYCGTRCGVVQLVKLTVTLYIVILTFKVVSKKIVYQVNSFTKIGNTLNG